MSDSAFKSAPFPGLSTAELRLAVSRGSSKAVEIQAEIDRREKAAAGDTSVMTAGERLRYVQALHNECKAAGIDAKGLTIGGMRDALKNKILPEIQAIATRHLDLETLLLRGRDSLDFSEQSVMNIRSALEAAYEAGRKAAQR